MICNRLYLLANSSTNWLSRDHVQYPVLAMGPLNLSCICEKACLIDQIVSFSFLLRKLSQSHGDLGVSFPPQSTSIHVGCWVRGNPHIEGVR